MTVSNADMLSMARELPDPGALGSKLHPEFVRKARPPDHAGPNRTAALADSPCGLWLARDTDDLIFHETGTSDYHIDQIVRHEVGHMVLGHGRTGDRGSE